MKPDLPQILFLLNSTVLFTHQIDAAYWHEWNLFHLPGGNQLNLILNHRTGNVRLPASGHPQPTSTPVPPVSG